MAFDFAIIYALERVGCSSLTLKPEQKASIKAVYDGKDVFVWLPTGFGKSICYTTLPFVFDYKLGRVDGGYRSVVVVVSPLISLMIDQVTSLTAVGVNAHIVTSGAGVPRALLATDDDLSKSSILFCAPEALMGSKWRGALEKPTVSDRIVAVVVDEAHCVSKWSRDFRPSYGRVHEIRALIPRGTPYLACTATVTRSVREEVLKSLEMVGCEFVSASPDRSNSFYEVYVRTDIETDMQPLVESLKNHKTLAPQVIVYCRSLNTCADLYAHFHYELGSHSYFPAGCDKISDNRLFAMFHANTSAQQRRCLEEHDAA